MPHFDIIANLGSELGEGPIWDTQKQQLWWTDIFGGFVYCYNPVSEKLETVIEGHQIAGFSLNEPGGLICAHLNDGLQLWTEKGGFKLIAKEFEGIELAFNDSTADANGRYYICSKYYDPDNADYRLGKLFQVGNDGSISIRDEGLHLGNGMGFSPDNRTFYLADSVARKIYAYDFDLASGVFSNKRTLITLKEQDGLPDGLTVDAAGFIWCAMWYGSCVIRFDPEGREERRLPTPMKQTSSVMFGGADLTDLYITTAGMSWRSHLAPAGYDFDASNIGGPVYRYRADIMGKVEYKADVSPA